MEVKLDKRYPVQASVAQAWTVLCDIRATAACMPGAQITEQIDDTHFKGTVKTKIGPAAMLFNGEIELQGQDAEQRELRLQAKGADKAGSSATMTLTARVEAADSADACTLVGTATVVVSGKLAQFGSRLLVPVSDALLAQFADHFQTSAKAVPMPGTSAATLATAIASDSTVTLQIQGGQAPGALAPAPAMAPATIPTSPAPVRELNALKLVWIVIRNWFAGLFRRKA